MYHSALVALKPGKSNDVLTAYAVRLARERGLQLCGIAVLDKEREAPPEAVPIGGTPFKVMRDEAVISQKRQQTRDALAQFTSHCREAGVSHSIVAHEDGLVGDIAQSAHRIGGLSPADLLRAVFLHLQRKNRSDSVGR